LSTVTYIFHSDRTSHAALFFTGLSLTLCLRRICFEIIANECPGLTEHICFEIIANEYPGLTEHICFEIIANEYPGLTEHISPPH